MKCPYCNNEASLAGGDTIYPHRPDLHFLQFWACQPCDAYVGCHKGTTRPLGRLANAELRAAKIEAHTAFDPLWKFHTFGDGYQRMTRNEAYGWLAEQLGMARADCHIGMLNVEQCQRVVEVCSKERFRQ
jgi:hypothetical protein